MNFLLAVSSDKYSGPTLRIGSQIAESFKAKLTIVYVGPKPKELFAGKVSFARDSLAKWKIYHPGIEVLRWAFNDLQSCGYLNKDKEDTFDPINMVEGKDRYRMVLPSRNGQEVDLVLREGEIIDQLRKECNEQNYTISIIGGSKERNMAHDLIQYLPTSVFVMKNVKLNKKYNLIICVDDSSATKRAVRFGAIIAKQMGMSVTLLTVSRNEHFGQDYLESAKSASLHLDSLKLSYDQKFISGDPVRTFIDSAGEDHIIVMGASTRSAFAKFFVGSKPIKTLQKANCPILIVKGE